MKLDVIFDKGGDEIVAVVVALAHVKLQGLAFRLASLFQLRTQKLFVEEFIAQALIDKERL